MLMCHGKISFSGTMWNNIVLLTVSLRMTFKAKHFSLEYFFQVMSSVKFCHEWALVHCIKVDKL